MAAAPASDATVTVTVLYFAQARDLCGTSEEQLVLPSPATTSQAIKTVLRTHPQLEPVAAVSLLAVNEQFVEQELVLKDGDELAVIPPVRVGEEPLDVGAAVAAVTAPGCGGICVFVGTTRDSFQGRAVTRLEYEAYVPMALRVMRTHVLEPMRARWPVHRACLLHRLGAVPVEEASVVVAVSTPHRADAFEACRFGIDTLKACVPVWKREFYADGGQLLGDAANPNPSPAGPAAGAPASDGAGAGDASQAAGPAAAPASDVWKANAEAAEGRRAMHALSLAELAAGRDVK